MKMFVCAVAILAGACGCAGDSFENRVQKAVAIQMESYPASHLKDLYKSFFQDRFGLGHIIEDTAAVRNYLEEELAVYKIQPGIVTEMVEPTGYKHNYYRVSIDVVKSGKISVDQLTDAVIRSANEAKPVTVEKWKREWKRIEQVISSMNLRLPDYETELKQINKALEQGVYVGHHSEIYNFAYNPHYRIISRKIYENELLPLMESRR